MTLREWTALCAGLVLLTAACSRETSSAAPRGARGGGPPAFAVEVAPVSTRAVEYAVNAVGSVEAFEVVQVTGRVPGVVEKIHFREGSRVQKGDVLAEIEPDRYRLAAEEARALFEKAKAAETEAAAGLARREGANAKTAGLIPGEEIDAWRTRVVTARAEVAAQEAALQLAKRNAEDALARAPFGGVVQTRDARTGQYVQAGTLLTTLIRREPLLLRFQIPEGDAARIDPGMVARFRVRNAEGEHTARIVHVAESADPASRMVAVTAEVEKDDAALRPGAFAEVSIPIGAARDTPVIPQTSVRPSERGFLAFVVSGGVAHVRTLELGLRTADGLVEVRSGLAAAESLVVRGAEALQEGAKVRVVTTSSTGSEKAAPAGQGQP